MSYLFHLVRREINIKEIERRKLKKERRQMTARKKKACKRKEIPGKQK